MATTQGNKLATGFKLQNALTTAYTAPSTISRGMVTFATVRNYGSASETFTVYFVPSGATADANYKAVIDRVIDAGETILLMEIIGEGFAAGDTFQAFASTSDVLSMDLVGALAV